MTILWVSRKVPCLHDSTAGPTNPNERAAHPVPDPFR
eukprot:CAMPEP_0194524818 /NCGR_PEP_ID=MMETSP0253-20130528/60123_1 /TAXON_ID=2966 /ORGANISM="Noctiluca scintillans" /LENGTH=36 /DNA_ID= /DNA_START= /DNA_END= /DNA_ORIENTATION=